MTTFNRLWQDDDGQDVVEYALIALLVSLAAYLTVGAFGISVGTLWGAFRTAVGAVAAAV